MADRGVAGVYGRLLWAQIRGQLSYRASFALDLLANTVVPVAEVTAIVAVFQVTRMLGGFTAVEVLLMYGVAGTAFALADLAVGNVERLQAYVRQGLLDAVLVRPLPVLGQLVVLDFSARRVARVVVALIVLTLSASSASIAWTPSRWLLVVCAPVFGAVIFASVFIATATVSFWWIDSGEFANGFTYGGRDFTAYPITVYSGALRMFFAYGLGFAFVAYYPVIALLGRPDPLGLPPWIAWSSPGVALIASGVAGLIWRTGLRHYRSTGS